MRTSCAAPVCYTLAMESVLSQQQQNNRLFKGLYKPQMQSLLSRYTARFLQTAVSQVQDQRGMSNSIAQDSHLKGAISAALTATAAPFSAERVAEALYSNYHERNDASHINTDARLKKDMKVMVDADAVDLLSADMPMSATSSGITTPTCSCCQASMVDARLGIARHLHAVEALTTLYGKLVRMQKLLLWLDMARQDLPNGATTIPLQESQQVLQDLISSGPGAMPGLKRLLALYWSLWCMLESRLHCVRVLAIAGRQASSGN